MKFGENLKKLRKSKNLSQEELADKVNVSRQSVSKWETGEAYPEMNNILQLCKIFNCEINSLVNDNMVDLDSLDEEIKMSVVKFKKDKQKKVKKLSKAISVMAKIGKVCAVIGIIAVAVAALIVPVVGLNIKVKECGETTENGVPYRYGKFVVFGEKVEYKILDQDSKVELTHKNKTDVITDEDTTYALSKVFDYFEEKNMIMVVVFGEFALACLIVCIVLTYKALDHLDKLFININKGDTPFTMDNVEHIKKMAYLMIWLIIFPAATGLFASIVVDADLSIDFNLSNLLTVLVLFSLAYIFEYGYQIQLDSKGRIYGDENE